VLDIDEMGQDEIHELLHKVGYGHLGFIHEGKPCIMPMHYYLANANIYLFTTVGMKTHDIDADPDVCLQVEELHSPEHWRSALAKPIGTIIVMGRAKHLTAQPEIDRVMKLVKQRDANLSPAINRTWTDSWGRAEVISIYQIESGQISSRTTDGVSSHR
jgi:uncharacterized protein